MADFRRWYFALAVPLLFTGIASAQVGTTGSTPLSCTANSTTTPTIRLEGETELLGDILITCTGGAIVPNLGTTGTSNPAAQQTNIIVTLPQSVTSRLVPSSTVPNASEALLLIDEPNSGEVAPVPGFGPAAPFSVCATPATGCGAFILTQTVSQTVSGVTTSVPYQTDVNSSTATQATAVEGANVFQGLVSGNQVTFYGVPIVPPGTNGQRVLRITNLRINASGLTAGASVTANVSVTGFTVSNPTPIVAFAQKSLSATATPASSFGQCNSQTLSGASVLTFAELFANAFKTRVDASVMGQSSTSATYLQDVPGHLYNSESGFTLNASGLTAPVGLADSGTRFTAVFNNLPANVRIFVSQYNVSYVAGGVSNTTNVAQEITGETIPDSNGTIPAGTASGSLAGGPPGTIPVVEITPTSGTTATATWELLSSTPTALQSLNFAVYITYTAAPGATPPSPTAPSTITVNERYGPASTATTATTGPIPRFLDTSTATNAISIVQCRTVLLFPFVTNQAGFDTGIAIANTSTDPFGTPPQSGTCSLNWYGAAAPATATTTAAVATGTDYASLASSLAPGFQGYMIAICNFQFAHGFAFVSDVGATKLAMGYLADVVPDPGLQTSAGGVTPYRAPSPALTPGTGENLGQ